MDKKLVIYGNDNKSVRKSKKGFNTNLRRKSKKYLKLYKNKKKRDSADMYNKSRLKYSRGIENFCEINKIANWKQSENSIKLNSDFSLFKKPDLVLKTLLAMLHRAKVSQKYTRLKYEGEASFGALYLIDNLCWEIAKGRKWKLICENITEVEKEKLSKLRSIDSSSYNSEFANMINERVRINRIDGPKADQSYRVRAKEITDMIQVAIREKKGDQYYELSFEAHQAIKSTIGEHFDNIILHAPTADIGTLCGFYDKEKKEVTILIYNFGHTIFETLATDLLPEQIKKEISEIIQNHSKNNFMSLRSNFTVENAVTLLAIQEGISSRAQYDKSRGHGLMDFIEHCFNLSSGTKIVIISGKTAIRIDNRYQIVTKDLFGRNRRIIAFNDNNDLYEKPSSEHIVCLNNNFPGVLIETTIPLNI